MNEVKVTQSYPTFCDPMYYTVPGILQARILEWAAFATPWTIQSMDFSRPEYWSGQPFSSPRDLSSPDIEPFPALQADSLPTELSGSSRKARPKADMVYNIPVVYEV